MNTNHGNTRYRVSPDQHKVIERLFKSGETFQSIAIAAGLPETAHRTISRYCAQHMPTKHHIARAKAIGAKTAKRRLQR